MKHINKPALLATVAGLSLVALTGCSIGGASSSGGSANASNTSGTGTSTSTNATSTGNTSGSATGNGSGTVTNATGSSSSGSSNPAGPGSSTASAGGTSGTTVGTGNTSVSTSAPNSNPDGAIASDFPTIVQMAMRHMPSSIRGWADAPTMYPLPAIGGNTLFYQTRVDTTPVMSLPGEQRAYNVMFNDKRGHMLARFGGSQYDTATHAKSGILGSFGDVFGVSGSQKSKINLATGLTGTTVADSANNVSHVLWSEGRWHIDVSQDNTTKPAITEANEVVNYLHTHFLPVPQSLGEIAVNIDGSSIGVNMIWQKGADVYEVTTNSYTKQPIQTCLAMAISMKQYH